MRLVLVFLGSLLFSSGYVAQAHEIDKSEVSFSAGSISLSGTLVLPDVGKPVPGIVLVHGSGPGERSEMMGVAEMFARNGIAALVYDKRGSGKSSGNWVTSSVFVLASDAAAAYRYMIDQQSVNADATGFWGISQGGWIVPLAANKVAPAFSIVITGGGATPRQVEYFGYKKRVGDLANTAESAAELELMLDVYMNYLSGVTTRAELDSTFDRYRSRDWFPKLGIEKVVPSAANRKNWAWVATFDPRCSIATMTMPILVLLGDNDPLLPTKLAYQSWRSSFSGIVQGSDVSIIAGAGHGLRTRPHGGPLIDNYIEIQLDWLRSIGVH